jgi:hypothetical protein
LYAFRDTARDLVPWVWNGAPPEENH